MPHNVTKLSVAWMLLDPLNAENPGNNYYKCKIEDCKAVLSGKKKWNLVAHFEKKHASFFNENLSSSIAKRNSNKGELEQRRLEHIQYLTQLVTVNGRPFMHLSDSGLIGLTARELKYLQDAGYGEGLTGNPPPAVMRHIEYLSSEIKSAIKLEVQNSLVSLMVDIGSRNGRDILGISMQYMHDGRVIIRSIGMILLTSSHTGANIEAEILACLDKLDIKPAQVISITTDNGSNMLKMVKLFNHKSGTDTTENSGNVGNCEPDEFYESEQCDDLLRNADIYDDDYINSEINNIIEKFNLIQSMSPEDLCEAQKREAEILEMLDDSSHYNDLLKSLQNEFATHTLNSYGIKCAAHTLQLVVKKSLKATQIRVLIDMCRVASKLLRKSSYKNRLLQQKLEIVLPQLDCEVRWNSTHKMVTSEIYFILYVYLQLILYVLLKISIAG